jgi:CheY-like chemotaxis protein
MANMSHELRTPLNSLLILAGQLTLNPDGNLTQKQVEYAQTIQASGSDLLTLINDILDLSKIESGTVTVEVEESQLADVRDQVERTFRHIAESKGLNFVVELSASLPEAIYTDADRLQQVLKNLLSNAFKFTEQGQVALRIFSPIHGWSRDNETLGRARQVIAFEVSDTGIGVPVDKQKIIFEAFQQAEGGSSRKFGGTGLGLAISRELAALLGGELQLTHSVVGQGSTFTFYIPENYEILPKPKRVPGPITYVTPRPPAPSVETVADDRPKLQPGEPSILLIEDDPVFARILLERARSRGLKGLIATRGDEALSLAQEYQPSAITLDFGLPDIDGRLVLDRLKMDARTRHIPIHVISVEDDRQYGLGHGAFGYSVKPVSEETISSALADIDSFTKIRSRKLLIVEDNQIERNSLIELLGGDDLQIKAVSSGAEALAALQAERFDCIVLDLKLPDLNGFRILKRMEKDPALRNIPAIVYTGRDLTRQEENQLQRVARTIIVKDVHSPERLLAETTLFLHRNVKEMSEAKRRMLEKVYQSDAPLTGKKVLLVDDDVRNLFAVTGVLERHRMEVFIAKNGKWAIELLEQTPEIDMVLMDIMMPGMDGYDTIRAIRSMSKFRTLPIIAVTAKAMKGDREKCLEVGASDYIAKPVDVDQLLSLMRVWLHR